MKPTLVFIPTLVLAMARADHSAIHSFAPLPPIATNDNLVAAGTLRNGTLDVHLDARDGAWHPYGPTGPAITVQAFGETGKPLQTPGPMIRVKVGTQIHATVTNSTTSTLVVHGLADRHRALMDTLVVPVGGSREVTFTAADAGTFFYWGTTTGAALRDRLYADAELSGALLVDSVGAAARPDRVFVVQWYVPRKAKNGAPEDVNGFFTFNGRPWPYTERLEYTQGDSVHWRIINTTADIHPLHLHGFYFRITAQGDAQRDTLYWKGQERMGVTQLMEIGSTMDLSWFADRPGAWVYHCHLNWHVVPNPTLGDKMKSEEARTTELLSAPEMGPMQQGHPMDNHAEKGMGGLVLAMTIKPKATWKPYSGPRERLRLYIQSDSQPSDTARRFGYALATGNEIPAPNAIRWPGPPIILHKGKPTSIWVINHSTEPSQVHWHGLEIDSYYDGVAGISSNAGMVSPMIMPRDSFEVTVTPPRAGSFMYHTHIDDIRQQSHGLYGPIIVLDSGQTWNPTTDLIFQLSTDPTDSPILNGSASPPALTLHTATSYRVRLMNISLDNPAAEVWLTTQDGAALLWMPLAKDGFELPVWQRVRRLSRQLVSIGETYDFQLKFSEPGDYAMESKARNGTLFAKQVIHVVK